jgi:lactate permease
VAAWKAGLFGLVIAAVVAFAVFRMPVPLVASAGLYGAAFGTFPIFWVVYWAIVLYNITVESGMFAIIRDSIAALTSDRNLQGLLIAFAFGAFLEGAAGFGTPVAVAGAILGGLGFPAFYAAGICLLANTAPVAFGSIAIPLVTLAATTGLPIEALSRDVGRLCAPLSLFIPAYLILVMGGRKALRSVWPGALVCGCSFAGTQFLVSNFIGPYLTDILSSIAAMLSLVTLLRLWRPAGATVTGWRYSGAQVFRAWMPYLVLVVLILTWSVGPVKALLEHATMAVHWPGLPNTAIYRMRILAEAGTACCVSSLLAAGTLRVSPKRFLGIAASSAIQLRKSYVSIASVLALAFIMNYCGATTTLGHAFASTGKAFPFFSAMLGWLGVFLTGSDTSANALFGNLQQVTAKSLGLSAVLMAAANSAGGVMGKMISLQSISVAAAAAGLASDEEPRLFRFTLRHSLFLASMVGVLTLLYAYAT